jgi:hypothetical protein
VLSGLARLVFERSTSSRAITRWRRELRAARIGTVGRAVIVARRLPIERVEHLGCRACASVSALFTLMLSQYVLRGALYAVGGSGAAAFCGTGNSIVDLFESARDWRDDCPGDIGCFEGVSECETDRTAD